MLSRNVPFRHKRNHPWLKPRENRREARSELGMTVVAPVGLASFVVLLEVLGRGLVVAAGAFVVASAYGGVKDLAGFVDVRAEAVGTLAGRA